MDAGQVTQVHSTFVNCKPMLRRALFVPKSYVHGLRKRRASFYLSSFPP
jgi:hypothetical protein